MDGACVDLFAILIMLLVINRKESVWLCVTFESVNSALLKLSCYGRLPCIDKVRLITRSDREIDDRLKWFLQALSRLHSFGVIIYR